MNSKIAIGVAVALVASCCGFALYRHFAPNHHAYGDTGCYASTVDPGKLAPKGCIDSHEAEIIDFFYPEGAEAGCHQAAEDFLGGPLADGRVQLRRLSYVRDDYTSLACALVAVSDSEGTDERHTGSLRGALGGARPMAITCGEYTDGVLVFGDCGQPHSAEYVGSIVDGGDHDASCRQAAAAYLGAERPDLAAHWLKTPRDGGRTGCVVATVSGKDELNGSLKHA